MGLTRIVLCHSNVTRFDRSRLRFTDLPLRAVVGAERSPHSSTVHDPSAVNTYVAIVDDDESVRRAFRRLLGAAGFQTISYHSAEAFLDDGKHPRFDCLLLDIQLTGMSGTELAQRLAAVRDPTPIVFVTANDGPEYRREAEAVGCAGYFRKTDGGQAILDTIRRAVGIPHEALSSRTAKNNKPCNPDVNS